MDKVVLDRRTVHDSVLQDNDHPYHIWHISQLPLVEVVPAAVISATVALALSVKLVTFQCRDEQLFPGEPGWLVQASP